MKRLKLYLETSVWNFLFASDAPEKMEATKKFFDKVEAGKFEIFISQTVLEEIGKAPTAKKELLLGAIRHYSPAVLEADSRVDAMAEAYISNGLLNRKHLSDVFHLAGATANEIDILLSWNMRHMVNLKTKAIVSGTNRIKGYSELTVCTPEEVLYLED